MKRTTKIRAGVASIAAFAAFMGAMDSVTHFWDSHRKAHDAYAMSQEISDELRIYFAVSAEKEEAQRKLIEQQQEFYMQQQIQRRGSRFEEQAPDGTWYCCDDVDRMACFNRGLWYQC